MARGSVIKRILKTGEVVWDLKFDAVPPPGKTRLTRKVTFHGKRKDADQELARLIAESWGLGVAADRTLTVAAFLADWLAHYKRRRAPTSYAAREQIVRNHILPTLGHIKLAALTPRHVQRWLDEKEAAGFAPNFVRDMLTTLKTALKHALAMDLVPRNAAAPVEAPAKGEPIGKAWTVDEARAFLASERGGEDWPMWVVAANAQLRRAEIAGLRWEDVDVARGLLHVRRQLRPVTGGGLEARDPKTAKSKRVLPMAAPVMAVLERHRQKQQARREIATAAGLWDTENEGWVFDPGDGGPMLPQTVYERFRKACKRSGVPTIRLHDVRHTGITLMGEGGISEFVIQQRAGHSDAATTAGYSHPTVEIQRAAAELLAQILGIGTEDIVTGERTAAD